MICPQCQQANTPGIFICSNCGFNSQLGQRTPSASSVFWRRLIIAASVTGILGMLAIIAMPTLLNPGCYGGPETGAVQSLKSIHDSQLHYHSIKGKFGTLKELTEAGLLTDQSYANGKPVTGYIFTDSDISTDTYCIHADRADNNSYNRDFNITEDGIVRFIESKTKGTVARGEGKPITSTEATTGQPDEAPKK